MVYNVSHTNFDVSHGDTEIDLDVDVLAEYHVPFGKFSKLSDKNIQLIQDTAVLKA